MLYSHFLKKCSPIINIVRTCHSPTVLWKNWEKTRWKNSNANLSLSVRRNCRRRRTRRTMRETAARRKGQDIASAAADTARGYRRRRVSELFGIKYARRRENRPFILIFFFFEFPLKRLLRFYYYCYFFFIRIRVYNIATRIQHDYGVTLRELPLNCLRFAVFALRVFFFSFSPFHFSLSFVSKSK